MLPQFNSILNNSQFHIFLTAALAGGEWSASRPWGFTPGTHQIGYWVGPRAGLGNVENILDPTDNHTLYTYLNSKTSYVLKSTHTCTYNYSHFPLLIRYYFHTFSILWIPRFSLPFKSFCSKTHQTRKWRMTTDYKNLQIRGWQRWQINVNGGQQGRPKMSRNSYCHLFLLRGTSYKIAANPERRSVKRYAIIAPAYAYWLFPLFTWNPQFIRITINNFVTLPHVLLMFLRSLFCFGTECQIYSEEKKWKNKNLCSTRYQVAKLFIMRKFLTTACKALTFHLYHPTPLLTLWSITNTEYLCLGKLKVGKLERKFCFQQRYLYSIL
jgi:hypothetical protein